MPEPKQFYEYTDREIYIEILHSLDQIKYMVGVMLFIMALYFILH